MNGQVRFWQGFSVGLAGALVLALGHAGSTVVAQANRARFAEIDVERINIVSADGGVRMVISNSERQTPGVIDGMTLPRTSARPPGMIFFNEEGDEVGGLIYRGSRQNGQARASGSLTFDRFKQDQAIALQYVEENGRQRAGLQIVDRPDQSLAVLAGLIEKRDAARTDAERAVVEQEIAKLPSSATRMFAGRDIEGRATLALSDDRGRARLRLAVAPDGTAQIQFLDEQGRPTLTIPD